MASLERETSTGSTKSTTYSYTPLRTSSVDLLKCAQADYEFLKSVVVQNRRGSDASTASCNGDRGRRRRKTRPPSPVVDSQSCLYSKGMYMRTFYSFTKESVPEKALRRLSGTSADLLLFRPQTPRTTANGWRVESVREIRRRKMEEEEKKKKSGFVRKIKKACCSIFDCFSCKH